MGCTGTEREMQAVAGQVVGCKREARACTAQHPTRGRVAVGVDGMDGASGILSFKRCRSSKGGGLSGSRGPSAGGSGCNRHGRIHSCGPPCQTPTTNAPPKLPHLTSTLCHAHDAVPCRRADAAGDHGPAGLRLSGNGQGPRICLRKTFLRGCIGHHRARRLGDNGTAA